jgi:hypothetical protein
VWFFIHHGSLAYQFHGFFSAAMPNNKDLGQESKQSKRISFLIAINSLVGENSFGHSS